VKTSLHPLGAGEVDGAHALYLEVFEWLRAKGVRQWLRAISREEFAARQGRGELFGHDASGRLAAIVTLAGEADSYWPEKTGGVRCWWIKTLAVSRQHRGGKLGARVMQQAEAVLHQAGASEAWLDCVATGILPDYYARLGYAELGRKDITYPSGNTFPMVLMRKAVLQQPPPDAKS
jgi:hypothetical protein